MGDDKLINYANNWQQKNQDFVTESCTSVINFHSSVKDLVAVSIRGRKNSLRPFHFLLRLIPGGILMKTESKKTNVGKTVNKYQLIDRQAQEDDLALEQLVAEVSSREQGEKQTYSYIINRLNGEETIEGTFKATPNFAKVRFICVCHKYGVKKVNIEGSCLDCNSFIAYEMKSEEKVVAPTGQVKVI